MRQQNSQSDDCRQEPIDPLPFPPGDPPRQLLARDGTPPDGFLWLGAKATVRCWLLPCPACCQGWAQILPDGDGYRLAAEIGCSIGCEAPEILWWQSWRLGEIPPCEPAAADERSRRRAAGIVSRILTDVPERPSERQLTAAAYQSGRWLDQGALPAKLVASPLMAAAVRAGLDLAVITPKLATALTAGRARPGRLSP
jgi:hypothetical protein